MTKGVRLDEQHFGYKFTHLCDHIEFFQQTYQRTDLRGTDCLELGTGWYPVVPIGLFLKGAERVRTVDISALTNKERILTCIAEIVRREDQFKAALGADIAERFEVLRKLHEGDSTHLSLPDICRQLRLELIVRDARDLEHSADFIVSNNTFEHVYPEVLSGILQQFWKLLRSGGLMSHFIDMSDHFAHMDSSISIYNFLQFSEKEWQRIDNDIQPQNRWRLAHYCELYDKLGIPYEKRKLRPGDVAAVRAVGVHEEFRHLSWEELAISHGYLLSRK